MKLELIDKCRMFEATLNLEEKSITSASSYELATHRQNVGTTLKIEQKYITSARS